ncbi:MAG TPA: uroporphyrinogen-III synthase, partial [Chloroflexota bacterium]
MTRRSQRTDSRALEGVRVLDTRPQTESGGLRARLESVGATVLELPTIAIHPVRDAVARVAPNEYDWIVFTSRNAVQAVSNLLATLAADATHHAKIAAVGKSTAAELGAHGVEVALIPDEATARALTSALVEHGVQGARILLPVGNLASGELREELERAGASVELVVVYET